MYLNMAGTPGWVPPPDGSPTGTRPRVWRSSAPSLKENGKVIGSAGYVGRHQTLLPGPDNEIGYAMSPACWGRGLMPEAVREILRYGFEDLGLNAQWCGHYDFNDRSRRVVEKCGFRYRFTEQTWVELMGEERTELHYALTREEWQAL